MNELIDMTLFYITYEQNLQIRFESQTEINEYDLMIK